MGASIDTGGDKKSVDVHLNIVPFIDLMSCLTAFLLVTAVWSNLAQISIKPKGLAHETPDIPPEEEKVQMSILIEENAIWVGLSRIQEFKRIPKSGESYDWEELKNTLAEHKKSSYFLERQDVEVGANDQVVYQTIVSTMDVAIAAGFIDVGLLPPNRLSAQPIR